LQANAKTLYLIILTRLLGMLSAALLCLVVGISDGDTLTARCGQPGQYEQVKVRLQGIDAPERKQPFGNRAREVLSELTYMKEAELRCNKIDHYKRHVCSVWIAPASTPKGPRTLDAGLAMITTGMAWWYRAYAKEQSAQERGQYEFAEQEAKARKAGLWRDLEPIAPRELRRSRMRFQSWLTTAAARI
jgi:endonuclease YncB( thermonuclease family)